MARAATKQAADTFNQAKGVAGGAQANSNDIFSSLLPMYKNMATAPQGIGDTGLNAENTASMESTGGAVSGAVGQNNLMAARTRNKGGFQIANDEAAREGMRTNSANAVGNIAQNEQLKERQRQEGRAGMGGLYGENLRQLMQALGAENQSTDTMVQAGKSGWLQNTMGILGALNDSGKAAAGLGVKV